MMKYKPLLLFIAALLGTVSVQARDIHGVNGYYNFTAQQMKQTGNMFSFFVEGSKFDGYKHSDPIYDGDYVKFILGLNKDVPTLIEVGKNQPTTTTKKYEWRVSFNFLHSDPNLRLKITKNYPVVAWKMSLPINSVDSGRVDVGCEQWWINPYTGKEEIMKGGKYTGVNGLNWQGRMNYFLKFPGTKVQGKSKANFGNDSISFGGWNDNGQKLAPEGYVYDFVPGKKKDTGLDEDDSTMVLIRLPNNGDKAEFIVMENFYCIADSSKDALPSKHLLDRKNIEIPRWHMNFFAQADKDDADGKPLAEDKRPYILIKWMKTFRSIGDALATINEENHWGDGSETVAKTQLNYALYYAEQALNGFMFRNQDPSSPDDAAYIAYKSAYDQANTVYNNATSTDADYTVALETLAKAREAFNTSVDLDKSLVYNYLKSASGAGAIKVGSDVVTKGSDSGKPLTIGTDDAAEALTFVPTGSSIEGQQSYTLKTAEGSVIQATDGTLLVSAKGTPAVFTFSNRDGQSYDMKSGDFYYYLDANGALAAVKEFPTVNEDDYDAISSYLFTISDALADYQKNASAEEKTGLLAGWEFNDAPVDDPSTKGVYNGTAMTMSEYNDTKMIDNWRMSRWRPFSRVNQETVKNSDGTSATCLVLTSAPTYSSFDGQQTGLVNDYSAPAALRYDAGKQEPFYARDPSPRDSSIAYSLNAGVGRYFAIKMRGTSDVSFNTLTLLGANSVTLKAADMAGQKGDVLYWDLLRCGGVVGKNLFTSAFFSPAGFTSANSKLYIDWIRVYDSVDAIPEEKFADDVATGVVLPNASVKAGKTDVYTLDGRLVKQTKTNNVRGLGQGVYILKNGTQATKVIVK
ncbi:MAG: T9SS type A sorting domain-containing protein [Prevotella sp.]